MLTLKILFLIYFKKYILNCNYYPSPDHPFTNRNVTIISFPLRSEPIQYLSFYVTVMDQPIDIKPVNAF
jgi:hypothetical protein